MNKSKKVIVGIVALIITAGFVFGVLGFVRGLNESRKIEVDIPSGIADHIESKSNLIVVDQPKPLSTITSPLVVRGKARGGWYFEASFPIILTDWDGRIIAQWHATAQDEWMTGEFVPFEGTLEFENPSFPESDEGHFSRRGTLILQKDNPSGLPEHDDALEIPVWFEGKN